jgi:hypothetical protein
MLYALSAGAAAGCAQLRTDMSVIIAADNTSSFLIVMPPQEVC